MNLMAALLQEFQRSWLTSCIGICLFGVGVWLLTWNEGRAVHLAHSLDETYNNAIVLNPFDKVDRKFSGNVVHISGHVIVNEPLTAPEYGISIQAVKLKRRVQMFQWVEERTPRDDDDTSPGSFNSVNDYYYVTEWRDKLVDSSSFYIRHGHENPREIPLNTVTYIAPLAKVGNFILGHDLKEKFDDFIEVTSDERPEQGDIKLHMGIYYHCEDIWNPEVGDIRVQFYYAGVNGEAVTIIAEQQNDLLVPYKTSNGHDIALLRYGHLTLNQMISAEHFDARLDTWKLRGSGVFILYASSVCLARLLKIIFSRTPFLSGIISAGVNFTGNFILSISISLIVIATAWMLYRPMLGASLLLAAISPFLYCVAGFYNGNIAKNGLRQRAA
ncbi:hypothetical protein NQ317_009657 [Molorchus minor]|uniref:Transmembrane protein 43 homolog n=1 Tax=Molorchus minor TaxID=1323400 RepID=A0ABQ9JJ07_9CUCU|nr:hypothetical protein NQ317_009657 [Molorchus minor]